MRMTLNDKITILSERKSYGEDLYGKLTRILE